MALATYSDLLATLADWTVRGDMTADWPDVVKLAEGTLNAVLRDPRMVTRATLALTTPWDRVSLPTDFLEASYAQVASTPGSPLEPISAEQLTGLRYRLGEAGTPIYYALIGAAMHVLPRPSSNTSVDLDYYQEIPPLASNTTNWLLTDCPDLYLYACLFHAETYLLNEERSQVMGNIMVQRIQAALKSGERWTLEAFKTPGFTLNSPSSAPQAAA